MELSRSQQLALDYITNYARDHKLESKAIINHILKMSNIPNDTFETAVSSLKANTRIGLHFHPDRPNADGKTVAELLLEQGIYRSQFETHLSNGSVSAFPGGERDQWEKRIFGGANQIEGTTNDQRPKYGALNVKLHCDGPAPRFGSCYFLLSPKVSFRSTLTYLDSHQDPKEKGTYEEFDMILAALLEEAFTRESTIGQRDLTPTGLINHLLGNLNKKLPDLDKTEASRNLNHYIEAQVHGGISLEEDVEVLVADPSFKGTFIGTTLEKLCVKYLVDLYWHRGFNLSVDEVPSDFRGPSMPSLAARIAQNNGINANVIGCAVLDLHRIPQNWKDRGTYKEVLQELKLLWHVLVRYGKPGTGGQVQCPG